MTNRKSFREVADARRVGLQAGKLALGLPVALATVLSMSPLDAQAKWWPFGSDNEGQSVKRTAVPGSPKSAHSQPIAAAQNIGSEQEQSALDQAGAIPATTVPHIPSNEELQQGQVSHNAPMDDADRARSDVIEQTIMSPLNILQPLKGTQQTLESLQKPLNNLREPIKRLEPSLNSLNKTVGGLSHPIQSLSNPIQDLTRSTDDLKAPLNSVGNKVSSLRQPINELKKPINDLKEPINQLSKPVDELKKPITGLQRPISNLNSPMEGISISLDGVRDEMRMLREEIESIQSTVKQIVFAVLVMVALLCITAFFVLIGVWVFLNRRFNREEEVVEGHAVKEPAESAK